MNPRLIAGLVAILDIVIGGILLARGGSTAAAVVAISGVALLIIVAMPGWPKPRGSGRTDRI